MPADRRERPPLPRPLGALGTPLYRAVVARRNAAFDRGRGVTRARIPVVSIGNLSVGGTGKSPMVRRVAAWLLEAGRRPGVALRGYKRRPGEASDEQAEHAASHPGLPVEADPRRARAVDRLTDAGCDVALLDDGFQHRRLHRDLDIVLIDASRDPFADACLPAGWLREPIESLARAHAVVATHAERAGVEAADAMLAALRERAGAPALGAVARHAWSGFDLGDAPRPEPPAWLTGRRVLVACGVGHPAAFIDQARAAGADVVATAVKPDHHRWTEREAAALAARAEASDAAILTTAKDWTKLRTAAPAGRRDRFARPRLHIEFDRGEADLRAAVLTTAAPRPR